MRTATRVMSARNRAGFSLVELVIAVALSAILLAAIFQLVFTQNRVYAQQQGITDARQSLRAAGTLLAWELRHVSAAGGDIYAIGSDSISVRSYDATAVVCRKRVTNSQYGLHSISGEIETGDSAMFYIVSSNRTADDAWRAVQITNTNTNPGFLGMATTCPRWPGTPLIEQAVQIAFGSAVDTAGMRIGAAVRVFQRRTYRTIERDGRTWLAVREGAGAYQLLTGPLRSGDGLTLSYLNAAGATTTVPASVSAIEFTLRSESPLARTVENAPEDSMVMRVQLRG